VAKREKKYGVLILASPGGNRYREVKNKIIKKI
jgi:hypothetical protein